MPEFRLLDIPGISPQSGQAIQATHEHFTLKILLDSTLTRILDQTGSEAGFTSLHVAALIEPELEVKDDFYLESIGGERIDFRPILKQLISSELDADRMDYLQRDSLHAGVSYGQFDFEWLIGSLTYRIQGGKCFLALEHRALYAFEDFLISRYHMFLMVYFHYKTVVYDEMLRKALQSPENTFTIPSDIEKYIEFDDAHLFNHLSHARADWARRIVEKRPYRMLIELHSGIPATRTASLEQKRLLARIEKDLKSRGIPYLLATSTGELSKYFRKPADPIFVRYDNHYSQPTFIPLEQCTDLFQRYSEKRVITRLYVSPENYALLRSEGRSTPLPYEDVENSGAPPSLDRENSDEPRPLS